MQIVCKHLDENKREGRDEQDQATHLPAGRVTRLFDLCTVLKLNGAGLFTNSSRLSPRVKNFLTDWSLFLTCGIIM
jgi:hypothetical protein